MIPNSKFILHTSKFILRNSRKSFTLIELLIVIAIIAVLAATIIAATGSARKQARDARRTQDLDALKQALELYYDDYKAYPYGDIDSSSDSGFCVEYAADKDWAFKTALVDNYLSQIPRDPRYNEADCGGGTGYTAPDCYCYVYKTDGDQKFKLFAKAEQGEDFNAANDDGGIKDDLVEKYSVNPGSNQISWGSSWLSALSPSVWTSKVVHIDLDSSLTESDTRGYQIMVPYGKLSNADEGPIPDSDVKSGNLYFGDFNGNMLPWWKDESNNYWVKTKDDYGIDPNVKTLTVYHPITEGGATCDTSEYPDICNSYDSVFVKSYASIDSPVAEWLMDDGKDSYSQTVADSAGPNNGTYYGSALSFDGVDDYVDLGKKSVITPPPGGDLRYITITAWVKVAAPGNRKAVIGQNWNYYLRHYDTWYFNCHAGVEGDEAWDQVTGNTPVRVGEWTFIAATYDGVKMRIYVDGRLDREKTHAHGGPLFRRYDVNTTIGRIIGEESWFNGIIDEVRIYNRALSADEVAEHYRGIFSNETGLVGYWSFKEGAGDTAADESGNGNDGNLGGADSCPGGAACPLWSKATPTLWQAATNTAPWDASTQTFSSASALAFNGKDDYVDCGNDESLNITDEITIEAWVKLEPVSGGFQGRIIIGKRGTSYDDPYGLWTNQAVSGLIFQLKNENDQGITVSEVIDLADTWHHIVGTYDGDASIIYVDGKELKRNDDATGKIKSTSDNVYINSLVPERKVNGTIDEVRIYNTGLSKNEIGAHYYHSKCAVKGDTCDLSTDPGCRSACGTTVTSVE